MRKNFIKGLALAMAVCMGVVGCGSNSSSSSKTPDSSNAPQSSSEEKSTPAGDESSSAEESSTTDTTSLYPAYDLGGITLTLLNGNDLAARNPAGTEDEFQKQERQEWLDYIQEKYNVTLQFVDSPASEWDDTPQEIVNAYTAGKPLADIMDVYYNWIFPLIANDIIYDMTDLFADDNTYQESHVLEFLGGTWGVCSAISGEGLYYNADMIKNAGMEYTPAEMFDMGMWDYDNFYKYLVELKANMAEDEYPLFVAPYYWSLFASAANGIRMMDEKTGQLNYLNDAYLETMEFIQKLVNEGLAAIPDQDENGSYNNWGYPGNTFDQGTTVAMAHRAAWQAAGLVDKFDLGYVPYPWGSNVTVDADKVGESGAYLTLSDNYGSSYYDGQVITFTKGVEEKADLMQLTSMMAELMKWDSFLTSYEGESITPAEWLETGTIDSDLYLFARGREHLEFYNSVDLDFTLAFNGPVYGNQSIRSVMQSAYNADMALMVEAGYADKSLYNPVDVETTE